ncbi:LuxR C-terminal-related transcriptional regulator [Paraburkholderia sacchari]|uniref:LuxR C-terminal-related transcriptional regulator n=1 Tax=Paraburkholderia sacchari TaxID=159450 RepID=UPI00054442C5|nr:LuxR C-terminal-related transcriptional regulator [Paraburkholderia sacchari]NLP60669.1 helix-turn-helix transcriptional regulator [Paraburkholderia sacchari]
MLHETDSGLEPEPAPSQQDASAGGRALPRRSTGRAVARERLITQLVNARRKRCIVAQGPAGCGKTTLLLSWRESLLSLGFDVAWLACGSADNDPATLLDHLAGSLAEVAPGISREALMLGGRGIDSEMVERTIIALATGIAEHGRELVLVLDNLEQIADEQIHEALQWLIDYAPANLHLAIVSRSAVPLSLGRLRDQGLVLELDMRELRFSAAESELFLRTQLGSIDARDARQLHEITDGWVAGLELVALQMKRKKLAVSEILSPDTHARTRLHDARAFAGYFEREVLSHLQPDAVDLLERLAVCTQFCSSLCVALAGNALPAARVPALLAKLASDNLFTTTAKGHDAETWHRLNPLFREILLRRFRTRNEAQQREVHLAASRWFGAHDRPDESVRHALLAGEAEAAAGLVLSVARSLQARGELRKVIGLIRLLPLDQVRRHPGLRLWLAHLRLYTREYDACASDIAALKAEIPETDRYSRYRLTLAETALAIQLDDTDAAMSILPQLLHTPPDADGIASGARNNALSWLYMHRGDYERARRVQLDSPPPMVDGMALMGTSSGILNGRCLIGFSYALEGKYLQTERICRETLTEADARGTAAAEAACLAAALLGEVLYEFNELDAARKLLESRIEVLERVSIPDSVLRVTTVLSAVHWLAGHRLDSFAWLQRLEDYAAQHNLFRLRAHSLAEQMQRHLQCGQYEAADQALTRLKEVVARVLPGEHSRLAEVRMAFGRASANWHIAHSEFDKAAGQLEMLIELADSRGWQRHVACIEMQLATVEARRERTDAAQALTLSALRRGHRLGLVRSLLDTDPGALKLIHQSVDAHPGDPVLTFYLNRLQSAQRSVMAATAAASPRAAARQGELIAEPLSEREATVVSLLAQALPNKKIARTLGLSPETVKWHLRNIYGKLGVSSRDEAVARMRDLGLMP